jgi:hypothetical protein
LDLDRDPGDFEKDFLGGVDSLDPSSSLSLEDPELWSLLGGLGLGFRLPFSLPSLGSLLPFSLPLSQNFARGDLSGEAWGGFIDCILSVLPSLAVAW